MNDKLRQLIRYNHHKDSNKASGIEVDISLGEFLSLESIEQLTKEPDTLEYEFHLDCDGFNGRFEFELNDPERYLKDGD